MTSLVQTFKARKEILGINDRNYNFQYLNRGKRSLADNKLNTKKILKANDIPAPEVFGIIKSRSDLDKFNFEKLPKSFVLKPALGVKGAGINIYYNRLKDGRWVLADRSKHSIEDIKAHILNILDGQYTIGIIPRPSAAIFEERIKMHNAFKHYSYRGIPDIRVVVYKNVPVMAMLRLPTEDSEGKANISRGAIGVGIDMARGVTTYAVRNGRLIETVPGTTLRLSGIKIPNWNKLLRIASKCQAVSGLGFLGVDIIIDREKGPLVVELNSRPGLGIQVANVDGLKERLQRIKKLKNVSEDRAVRLAKDLFGGEIEEEIETISGREVVGLNEEITFEDKDGNLIVVPCKIDTGAESSSIDKELARKIGFSGVVEHYEEIITEHIATLSEKERAPYVDKLYSHPEVVSVVIIKSASGSDYRVKIEVPAKIKEKNFIMKPNIADRAHMEFPVLLGKKDLREFLIDPTR